MDVRESRWQRDDQRMVVGDINNTKDLDEAMKDQDIVYHLAALADLNAAKVRPVETAVTNVMGTVQLLNSAVRNKIERLVFASTVYVYSREGGFYKIGRASCRERVECYVEEDYSNERGDI